MDRIAKWTKWKTESLAVATVFMIMSLLFGAWLGRLPEVQIKLALTKSALGFALLGLPAGGLIGTQLASLFSRRISTAQSTFISAFIFCIFIVLPSLAFNWWTLLIGLFLVGLFDGWLNVAMNAAAADIEEVWKVSIMSSCHGMFSLGAMFGAGIAGVAASLEIPFTLQQVILGALMLVLLINIRPFLDQVPTRPKSEKQAFAWPEKQVWGFVFIGFCIMIGEGAIADWAAIYLKSNLGSSLLVASMGFAAFSFAMTIGRFSGDYLRVRYSAIFLVTISCLIGGGGLLLCVAAISIELTIIGFWLAGIGFSLVVPILFILTAQRARNPEAGIAAVATSGIVGFMLAPPIIGMVGDQYGLDNAFLGVAILAIIAAFISYRMR